MSEAKQMKLCPFLPPVPVKAALTGQQTFSFMSCQGSTCEVFDEAAKTCGMKTRVNIDMGHKEIHVGEKK